jgi:hypothetical protein
LLIRDSGYFLLSQLREQEHNYGMDAAFRIVQMIRVGMMASVVLYAIVGEEVIHPAQITPDSTFYFAITLIAFVDVGLIVPIRRRFVIPSEAVLARQPDDQAALGRWRMGYIITYALSEAVALFGLVLRSMGFRFSQVVTFYLVGLILMMFFGPHRPSHELG